MKLIIQTMLLFNFWNAARSDSERIKWSTQMSSPRLNYFDIDLLRNIAEDTPGNVVVSPASIRITLAMLLEGAGNTTAKEIRNALRLSENTEDRKTELYLYINALQVNSPTTTLETANGLFVSKKLELKSHYETAIKRDFAAEITKIDFNDGKKASDLVNGWVYQKTHGLIPSIVEPEQLDTSAQMVLTNALYFKNTWKYAFDALRTSVSCFYRSGVCEKVNMMELEADDLQYAHVRDLRAHAVELPYKGDRYSMILLVPLDQDGCKALLRDLPFVSLAHIKSLMKKTEVNLKMPKFTVNYNGDMIEPLAKLHINSLFSSNSNLSGIFHAATARVTNFQQKVYMSVDEVGTVAAAVSSAVVVPLSFSGVDIVIDKPFVFFIKDNDLGVVLFEGKIEEPRAFTEPAKVNQAPVEILPSKPAVLLEPSQTVTINAPAVKPIANDNIVFRSEDKLR